MAQTGTASLSHVVGTEPSVVKNNDFLVIFLQKQMSFVYEQQTIIKLYKQARESSRKSEKSLRQIQRKLNAELVTCSSKTNNDYRQCIKTNRSLFELETMKYEKSVCAAEKVVAVADSSARAANGQNMKRCNDDDVIGFKNPSNNESKIPKLCKAVNDTSVKQRIMQQKPAKSFSSFSKAKQGSHEAEKCSTAPKKNSEQNLQLQPTASDKEPISQRCKKSVNRNHPSKGIIEIPMQYKPGKKHRIAQKSVSMGCSIRDDNSNKNAIVKKSNCKNRTIERKYNTKNDVIVVEDNNNNKATVKGGNIDSIAIAKKDTGYDKSDKCEQGLFCAADHCYTKSLEFDTAAPDIGDSAKTSTDMGKICDTGKLNSQMELKREGTKLIECLLQQVSETGLKRKRDDAGTESTHSLPPNSSFDIEAPSKKLRLQHAIICDQLNVGYHSEKLSNGCVDCKNKQQPMQSHSKIPRLIQNKGVPAYSLPRNSSYDFEEPLKGVMLEHAMICGQLNVGHHPEMLSNGCVDCKNKHQPMQSHSKIPRPIKNRETPVIFDVISYLKGMVNDAL